MVDSMSWSGSAIYGYFRTLGVSGLSNYGLSCCINALLQSFSATPELLNLLNRWQRPDDVRDHHNVPFYLTRVLNAMRDQVHPIHHQDFLNCLHHNCVHRFREHDADEVFHIILNLIKQQVSDQELAGQIQNLFKIVMEGHVKCSVCAYVHCVPTFSLNLALHLNEGNNNLEDCIQSFCKMQALDESEQFWCDNCERKQPVAQGFELVSLPPILCIHLKRYRNDRGPTRKLNCRVQFPESFSTDILTDYASENVIKGIYTLYAVIVHSGFSTFGHYTAFIYSTKDSAWYYTNDSHVQQATWNDVQQTYEGRYSTAYMLLYRRSTPEA